eukprot:3196037-Rhodomonas_salina.1
MCRTGVAYGAMRCLVLAQAYGATRVLHSVRYYCPSVCCYVLATQCPVLSTRMARMLLRARYTVPSTNLAYAAAEKPAAAPPPPRPRPR